MSVRSCRKPSRRQDRASARSSASTAIAATRSPPLPQRRHSRGDQARPQVVLARRGQHGYDPARGAVLGALVRPRVVPDRPRDLRPGHQNPSDQAVHPARATTRPRRPVPPRRRAAGRRDRQRQENQDPAAARAAATDGEPSARPNPRTAGPSAGPPGGPPGPDPQRRGRSPPSRRRKSRPIVSTSKVEMPRDRNSGRTTYRTTAGPPHPGQARPAGRRPPATESSWPARPSGSSRTTRCLASSG